MSFGARLAMNIVQFANSNIVIADQKSRFPISNGIPNRTLRTPGAVSVPSAQVTDMFNGVSRGANNRGLEADSDERRKKLPDRKPPVCCDHQYTDFSSHLASSPNQINQAHYSQIWINWLPRKFKQYHSN